MTDDEFRELFHRVELRLERLDTRVDHFEQGQAEIRADVRGLEARLTTKADCWVVSLWGASIMG